MSFTNIRKIPSPEEIIAENPLPENLKKIKAERDAEIKDILTGKSNKFILIIGRTSNILAPVVPIQLDKSVPISNIPVFTRGEPTKSPSSVILPATQNNPNNKTINVK